MDKANLYTLAVMSPPIVLLAAVYASVWGFGPFGDGLVWMYSSLFSFLVVISICIVAFIAGVVAHEAIHGLAWAYFSGKPVSAIKFGFQVKTLTPYAHCREPMAARAYRIGAAMPGLLLGLLPTIFGIATGSVGVMLFGLFFTFAAGGDTLVLWLIRDVDGDALVEDHPTNAGCFAYDANRSPGASRNG